MAEVKVSAAVSVIKARSAPACERCGDEMLDNKVGWVWSGRSRKFIRIDTVSPVVFAAWCPRCSKSDRTGLAQFFVNPTLKEVEAIALKHGWKKREATK